MTARVAIVGDGASVELRPAGACVDGVCDGSGPIFHAADEDAARTMARRHVLLAHPERPLDQPESAGTGAER